MSTVKKQSREELRIKHQVRVVTDSEEGVSFGKLSNGISGFTYSPAQESTPLFQRMAYQSFEVHKLQDGSELLLGYVTASDKAKIDSNRDLDDIKLYPDAYNDATYLITVPVSRIANHKRGVARTDGNYLKIDLHEQ